jgi:hypothetical protein
VYRDYNHFWDLEAPEDNTGLDCPNERFCQDDEIQQRIVDHLSAALSQ